MAHDEQDSQDASVGPDDFRGLSTPVVLLAAAWSCDHLTPILARSAARAEDKKVGAAFFAFGRLSTLHAHFCATAAARGDESRAQSHLAIELRRLGEEFQRESARIASTWGEGAYHPLGIYTQLNALSRLALEGQRERPDSVRFRRELTDLAGRILTDVTRVLPRLADVNWRRYLPRTILGVCRFVEEAGGGKDLRRALELVHPLSVDLWYFERHLDARERQTLRDYLRESRRIVSRLLADLEVFGLGEPALLMGADPWQPWPWPWPWVIPLMYDDKHERSFYTAAEEVIGPLSQAVRQFLAGLSVYRALEQVDKLLPGAPPPVEPVPVVREDEYAEKESTVNLGFAEEHSPSAPLSQNDALMPETSYWFWLDVGTRDPDSIVSKPVGLPTDSLPQDATLTVVLFRIPGELYIDEAASMGALQLLPGGSATVVNQPSDFSCTELPDRLFFRVQTPERSGRNRLRCNLYYRNVLVQSHLVTADVRRYTRNPQLRRLLSRIDYTLAHSLDSDSLGLISGHRLSVLLNGSNKASHQLRFFWDADKEPIRADADFTETQVINLISEARKQLYRTSWGTDQAWSEGDVYKYGSPPPIEQSTSDLIGLARTGYRLWDQVASGLRGSGNTSLNTSAREALQESLRSPGNIQSAAIKGAHCILPVSLIYDHVLDAAAEVLTLCPTFSDAWRQDRSLAETECFQGRCPSYGDLKVVCPSGFWGFRHFIGMPVSRHPKDGNLPSCSRIPCGKLAEIARVVSTDPKLAMRGMHVAQLSREIKAEWALADSRRAALTIMQGGASHLYYFYCHGKLHGKVLQLLVGNGREAIERSTLKAYGINWKDPRPLVLINGCNTASLDPSTVFDLVTGFVETSHAAGVVGAEITIFERLACDFGLEFLKSFVGERRSLGAAIREARLALLQKGNPLGLAYLPFGLAGLALLKPQPVGTPAKGKP